MYHIHNLALLLGVSFDAAAAEVESRPHIGAFNARCVSHKVAEQIATALGKTL